MRIDDKQVLNPHPFLSGGGEMGDLIRQFDWASSSLGPIDTWPQTLKTTVGIILHSRFPMFLFWGDDHICFYNDAYRPSLGEDGKHPAALGSTGKLVWPEIWDLIYPLIVNVRKGGEANYTEDQQLPIYRNGKMDTAYWTYSYSAVPDIDGSIEGVLVACSETTGKVKAFNMLAEKEDQLSLAIEASELGMWELDPINNKLIVSDRVRQWHGLAADEEITCELAVQLVSDVDREGLIKTINNALAPGSSGEYNIQYTIFNPKSDFKRVVHSKGKAFFNDQGQAYRLSGTLQDITEQVAIQARIARSESHFRQLTDTVPAIIWITDTKGNCTYLNRGWYEFSGMDMKVGPEPGWHDIIYHEDAEAAIAAYREAHISQKAFDLLYRLRHKDGQYRWIIDKGSPKYSDSGDFEGMIGTLVDVHEQILAENRTQQSEHFLSTLIEESPVRITNLRGPEHKVALVNETVLKSWNRTKDVIGKSVREVLPEMKSQPFFDRLDRVFQTGENYTGTNEKVVFFDERRPKVFYFDIWYKAIRNVDGEIDGVLTTALDVTEKVISQNLIAESEEKFRSLIHESPIATCLFTGPEMFIEIANDRMCKLWGKDASVRGKTLREAVPELEGQPFHDILADVYKTGIPFAAKDAPAHLVVDGQLRKFYFDYNYTPLFDMNGRVYGIMDTAVDVTQKVLAQQYTEESEKSLRNTILRAPVAMCILRHEDHIVEIANERMLELWGVSNDIIGRKLFDFLKKAKTQGFEELLDNVYYTGETYKAFAVPVDLPREETNKTFYVDFVYEAFRESDGRISGVIVVASEVTEQVMAIRKVEQAEERARLAIDSAELGVYEVNLITQELRTSERFNQIWGISKGAVRQDVIDRLHPEDVKVRADAHQLSLTTGTVHYEARVVWKDGSVHWVRVKGRLLYDDGGNPKSLLGVIQDINEQKQFAEQLTKLVNERTIELSRSNDELLQFAHVASHDLKEPVRKIKIFSNMLLDEYGEVLPEKAITFLSKIQNATNRMFSMIEGVLTYSSLNASDQPIDEVDMNEIIDNIESDLEILIQKQNAKIIRDTFPKLQGASVLLFQLFYNLINNALKFSRQDVPTVITISSFLEPDSGFVNITVSDNGIGIDADNLGRIFDAFARLHAKDAYEGTGLGLALCKRIVERHHGTITVAADCSNGATFIMRLPTKQFERLI